MQRTTKQKSVKPQSNAQQLSLTYVLGYEALRDIDASCPLSVHSSLAHSADDGPTLIAAFKLTIDAIQSKGGTLDDLARWCDRLAFAGDHYVHPDEHEFLAHEIDNLAPCLKVYA